MMEGRLTLSAAENAAEVCCALFRVKPDCSGTVGYVAVLCCGAIQLLPLWQKRCLIRKTRCK